MSTKDTHWRDSVRIIWAITAKDIVEAVKNKNTLTVIITSLFMLLVYRGLPVLESRGEPTNLLVYDAGESALVAFLENSQAVNVYTYPSEEDMKRYLANGLVPELGLVIPQDFDRIIEAGGAPDLQGYVMHWVDEETAAELKLTTEAEISRLVGVPVLIRSQGNIVSTLPDSGGIGVNAGFGFIFAITMIGLSMIPHLILEEKHSRTLSALLVSPASEWHVVAAKALTGLVYCALTSAIAAVVFYPVIVHWWLTFLALLCGSLFTIAIGLLLGAMIENRGQLTLLAWVFIIPLLIPVFLSLLDDLVPEMVINFSRVIPTVVTFNLLRTSFAGEFPLGRSLLQLAWIVALAGGVLLVITWLIRRRDRGTGGIPALRRLASWGLYPMHDHVSKGLVPSIKRVTESLPWQGVDEPTTTQVPTEEGNVQAGRWGSNQGLRIVQAIAVKDISMAIKNKIVLSLLLGTLLVVANGSLLPILLGLHSTPTAIVYDEGRSTIVRALAAQEEIRVRLVDSLEEMEAAVSEAPEPRLGLIIPVDFDQRAGSVETLELQAYFAHWANPEKIDHLVSVFQEQLSLAIWGKVQIETAGNILYPTVESGGQPSITSLMMFIVILTIGMARVPLLFLEERESHTIDALLISPASLSQVLAGKALAGAFYCLAAALVVMLINRYLIVHWGAVLLAVIFGAAFSVALGLLVGLIAKNQTSTGLWGSAIIFCLMALTIFDSFQIADWPVFVQKILQWQPGSTITHLLEISMAGEIPPGLMWSNAAALLAAALLVYALVLGMLRRADR